MDVLLLSICHELITREDGMALNLIDGRDEACLINELFKGFGSEVRHAGRASFALGQRMYSLPCLAVWNRIVDVHLVGIRRCREKIRVGILAWAEVDGPVDEVQILQYCESYILPFASATLRTYKVLKFKLSKSIIKSGLHSLGVVLSVPQLRCNEHIFTFDSELFEGALDTLGDLFLVLVAGWWKILSAQSLRMN